MSRRGICHNPTSLSLNAVPGGKVGSRKQRRANCVQKRSHGPKSRDDSFGTTLQRRCLEVLRFSLLLKNPVSACVNVLALRYVAYQGIIDISVDSTGINVT